MDKWANRNQFDYFRTVFLWVKIFNLPKVDKNIQTIQDIWNLLGEIEEINKKKLTRETPTEVWIKVKVDVDQKTYL